MLSKRWIAAMLAAGAVLPAWAVPNANASIDLSTWKVTVVDTDAADGLEASFSQSFLYASTGICPGLSPTSLCGPTGSNGYTEDPAASVSSSGGIADAPGGAWWGTAYAGPDRLQNTLVGLGATDPAGVQATEAFAFAFQGAGRVTVTADYTLFAGGLDGLSWRETLAWVGLLAVPAGGSMFQVEELAVAPGVGDEGRSGTLSISFDFSDSQRFTLLAHTHAHTFEVPVAAPVPEPAGWALMLAGTAMLAGARRRRR